jgi:hypothetical protein
MKSSVLRFGLVSAAVAVTGMAATTPLILAGDHAKSDLLGYSAMALSALVVYFGIRWYRDREATRIGFGRAFAVGLLITLVSALVQVAAFQIVYFRLAPGFGDAFVACMIDRAKEAGETAAKVEETARTATTLKRLYDAPLTNAAISFATPLPIGVVASALSALLLSRRTRRAAKL